MTAEVRDDATMSIYSEEIPNTVPSSKVCKQCGCDLQFDAVGRHGRLCRDCRGDMRRAAHGSKSKGISNDQRDAIELTDVQKQILVGHLLGDGNLHKGFPTRRPMFRMAVAVKNRPYLEWSAQELKSLIRTGVRLRKFGKDDLRAIYSTRRLRCLEDWYQAWYGTGVKALPTNPEFFEKHLTPLAIAVWYQDDGSLSVTNKCIISSEGFTKEENQRLAHLLSQTTTGRYNLSRIKHAHRLYVPTSEGTRDRFFETVAPYVHSHFQYKLPEKCVETVQSCDSWQAVEDKVQAIAA